MTGPWQLFCSVSRTGVEEGDGEQHHLGREEEVEGTLQRPHRRGVGGRDRRRPRTARLVVAVLGRAAEQAQDQHACGRSEVPCISRQAAPPRAALRCTAYRCSGIVTLFQQNWLLIRVGEGGINITTLPCFLDSSMTTADIDAKL